MKLLSCTSTLLGELSHLAPMLFTDVMHFISLSARSRTALAAENLFLRKQLVFYQEGKVRPRHFDNVSRWIRVLLSYGFAWKEALVHVTPKTFIGWHRIPDHLQVVKPPVLGGLHHEYELITKAA